MENIKTNAVQYSPEVQERVARMVRELQGEHELQWTTISSIAAKIGCTAEMFGNDGLRGIRGKLTFANAPHQLGACNRGSGATELLEATHDLRPGLDVAVADADGLGLSAFTREDLHSIAPELFRFAVRDIEHCDIDLT
jgi:hypothetical protein